MSGKPTSKYQFKLLDLNGLEALVQLAIAEGWNPGPHDAKAYWNTDPEGFYGYYDGDELLGGGSLVSYNGAFGFMGFFIMKPEYRGKGLGRELWYLRRDTLLKRLNPGAAIGMDGVVNMQPFYGEGGFELAYTDERYELNGKDYPIAEEISVITPQDFERIAAYDLQCFGFERKAFLKQWLYLPESKAFKYGSDNSIGGFAMIRKVNKGYKICPLFADDETVAQALLRACLNHGQGDVIYLDSPTANPAAAKLAKAHGGQYVFECGRMYHGTPPSLPLQKIFGVTTFELG